MTTTLYRNEVTKLTETDIVSTAISLWISEATSRSKAVRKQALEDFNRASLAPNRVPLLIMAARATGSTPKQVLAAMAKTARDKAGMRQGVSKR